MRKLALAAAATLSLTALTLQSTAASKPAAAKFGKPVKVTPDGGHGYEPTVVADKFGNLFATAHRENWQLGVAPDERATGGTRTMSWAWWSRDNGKTWQNLPTGPGDVYSYNLGVEGDMATDSAGNTYFADTNAHDITITAWKASGRGEIELIHHLPMAAFGEPLDDRPWITAHGDGSLYYLGNVGNKQAYPAGRPPLGGDGSGANGPGRYTVYTSHDHGRTWDHIGFTLNDSGWCRPAADLRSKYVYVLCGNDNDKLYSFVSADKGKTWKRYDMGTYEPAETDSYPTVQIAKDGSLWALHVQRNPKEPTEEIMKLYRSTNRGKSWTSQNITTKHGKFVYAWLGLSPDGKKLGLGTYFRAEATDPWKVYGATWTPGKKPVLVPLDTVPVAPKEAPNPPGDYLTANFSPDGKLNVVWTRVLERVNTAAGAQTIRRDIYFNRSL